MKLYSATESKSVSFHEVHVTDGARIEHKRICSKEDKEVPFKQVVKGYEVSRTSSSCWTRTRSRRPPARAAR